MLCCPTSSHNHVDCRFKICGHVLDEFLVHGEAHLEHSPRVITGPHLPSEPRRRSERGAGLGRRLPYLWGLKWSSLEAVLFVAVMESSCHLAPCCDGCFRWESRARGCRLLAVNWTFGEKVSEACPSTWCSEPWQTVDFLVLPVVDGQLVPRRRHRRVGKKLMEVVWRVCQVLSVGWFVRSSLCLLYLSELFQPLVVYTTDSQRAQGTAGSATCQQQQ